MLGKSELRKTLRAEFRALRPRDLEALASQLAEKVLQEVEKEVAVGHIVTLFGGLDDEVDLVDRLGGRLLASGRRVALFGLEKEPGQMQAWEVCGEDGWKRGYRGIWEPVVERCERREPQDLSWILVPGLAFDPTTGARLGRGGGYFDRYLAGCAGVSGPRLVGVCWHRQLRRGLPTEPHDQRVHRLITETDCITIVE